MGEKSFYDLDYIIEINEQRLDQYTAAYQKVLDKLTHIILVYSAITIFLIPLVQDTALFKIMNPVFISFLVIFLILLGITICLTFHISRKDENVQKVQLVNSEIFSNFMERNSLPQHDKHTTISSTTTPQTTQLPGIDNSQVIVSTPNIIKENGHKPLETKSVPDTSSRR